MFDLVCGSMVATFGRPATVGQARALRCFAELSESAGSIQQGGYPLEHLHGVRAGMGVTFVPDPLLAELDGFEPITGVEFGTIDRTVGLCYRRHEPLSEGAKRFLAICEKRFPVA